MGLVIITIVDNGPNVSVDFTFDPALNDEVEPTGSQVVAIKLLDTLEQVLAASAKAAEEKSQPSKEKTDE